MNSNTELINVILEVIMQNPTKDINEERPSRTNDPNNLWNIICSKLYDTTCYSDANRIFKLWHSNVSKLAEQVTSLCGSIYRNNGEKSFISLPVTAEEWTILTTYIVNSPRARFTSQFSDFLSEKLQECNIKYWIWSVRRAFIYSFTLIQNSVTVYQIEIYLINIHNLYMSKQFDMSVQYSLQTLASELRNRKLNNINIDNEKGLPNERERDQNFASFVEASKIYFVVNFDEKVKENSPWETLFISLIKNWDQLIETRSSINSTNLLANPFYCPELWFLLRRELYKLPLWTGVLLPNIHFSYEIKTRLSNNPVENHFLQAKYRLLNRRSRLSCSEIIGPFYSNILAKFFKYYDDQKELSDSSLKKIGATIHQDTWKPEKPKKVKGRLVDAADILGLSEKNSAAFNGLKFDELFDKFKMETIFNNTAIRSTTQTGQSANLSEQAAETSHMSEITIVNRNDSQCHDSSSSTSSISRSSNLENGTDIEINSDQEEFNEDILNWFSNLKSPIKDVSKSPEVIDIKGNESIIQGIDAKTIEK